MADGMPLIALYIGGVIRPKSALTLKNESENDVAAKRRSAKNKRTEIAKVSVTH